MAKLISVKMAMMINVSKKQVYYIYWYFIETTIKIKNTGNDNYVLQTSINGYDNPILAKNVDVDKYFDENYCAASIKDMRVDDNTLLKIIDKTNKDKLDILYINDGKFIRVSNDGSVYIHIATKKEEIENNEKFSLWDISSITDNTNSGSCYGNILDKCSEDEDDDQCVLETSIIIINIKIIDIIIKIKKIDDNSGNIEYKIQTPISGYENPTVSTDDITKYLDGAYCNDKTPLDFTIKDGTYLKISTDSEKKYYYLTDTNLIAVDENDFYIYKAKKDTEDFKKGYKLSTYTITATPESGVSGSCNGGNITTCGSCKKFEGIYNYVLIKIIETPIIIKYSNKTYTLESTITDYKSVDVTTYAVDIDNYISGGYCADHVIDKRIPSGSYLQIVDNNTNNEKPDILYLTDDKFVRVTNDGKFYIHNAVKSQASGKENNNQKDVIFSVWTFIDNAVSDISGSCYGNIINKCTESDDDNKCIKETGIFIIYNYFVVTTIKIKKTEDDGNGKIKYELQESISGYENPTTATNNEDIAKYLDGTYCNDKTPLDFTIKNGTYLKILTDSTKRYYYLTDEEYVAVDNDNFYVLYLSKTSEDTKKGYIVSNFLIISTADTRLSGYCNDNGTINSCTFSTCQRFECILIVLYINNRYSNIYYI